MLRFIDIDSIIQMSTCKEILHDMIFGNGSCLPKYGWNVYFFLNRHIFVASL